MHTHTYVCTVLSKSKRHRKVVRTTSTRNESRRKSKVARYRNTCIIAYEFFSFHRSPSSRLSSSKCVRNAVLPLAQTSWDQMAFFVFGFRTKRQRVFNRFIKRSFQIAVWNTPTFEPCLLSENANWADAKARENLKIVFCAFIRTTDVLTNCRDFFVKSVLIIRFYKRKKKTSRSKTIRQYLSLPPSTKISTHRRQRDVDSNYY